MLKKLIWGNVWNLVEGVSNSDVFIAGSVVQIERENKTPKLSLASVDTGRLIAVRVEIAPSRGVLRWIVYQT